jgi:hypothetical protein
VLGSDAREYLGQYMGLTFQRTRRASGAALLEFKALVDTRYPTEPNPLGKLNGPVLKPTEIPVEF